MDMDELFSAHGRVEELEITDEFCDHLGERSTYTKHIVSILEILEVHESSPKYFLNTGTPDDPARAPVIMVGPTNAGRFLCAPLMPTGRQGVWRPITAFQANTHHRRKYEGKSS